MRKAVSILLGTTFILCQFAPFAVAQSSQEPLQGSVIKTEDRHNPTVNYDDIKAIEKGTLLEMTVQTTLTTDSTETGEGFFAKVSKDYVVDGKVVIPRDTIVHGSIEDVSGPKRAGRNAHLSAKFDYLITPDGREIPIEGAFTSKDNKAKAAAKVVARGAGFTLAGGAVGAFMVLKYGGLSAVAATNGYALAGGAAVGGVAGLTAAMVTRGKHKMIQPGAEIKVKLQEGLELPTMNMPDPAADNLVLDGLDVKILGMRTGKDPFGEMTEVTLTLDARNYTENTFSTFEIALQDEFGSVFYPSPFGDTGMWFTKLKPNAKLIGNLTFNVDNAKARHYLVFYKQYTREPIAKFALTDAMVVDKKVSQQKLKDTLNKKTAKVSAEN